MAIVRGKYTRNYTVLTNDIVNDLNLSWDALGLLIYLISKPENWQVNVTDLTNRSGYGRAKIYRLLKQIRKAGYAQYTRNKDGKTNWTIYDKPRDRIDNEGQKPRDQFDHMAQIELDRADTQEKPKKPRDQFDHVLVNTDIKKNNDLYAQFMRFWDMYDKKVDRAKCEKKFIKLPKKTKTAIFQHLPKYIQSTPDKQYRKNPLTYLNSQSWLDEEIVTGDTSMDIGTDW